MLTYLFLPILDYQTGKPAILAKQFRRSSFVTRVSSINVESEPGDSTKLYTR
jgi:hypothetical protein